MLTLLALLVALVASPTLQLPVAAQTDGSGAATTTTATAPASTAVADPDDGPTTTASGEEDGEGSEGGEGGEGGTSTTVSDDAPGDDPGAGDDDGDPDGTGTSTTVGDEATVDGEAEDDPAITPAQGPTDVSVTVDGAAVPGTGDTSSEWTITVANAGPNPATGVVLTLTLPPEIFFVSASAGCVEAAGVVTCTIGDLASGASTIRTTDTVAGGVAPPGAAVTVTATVDFDDAAQDTDPANNTDSATIDVIAASADLSVGKSDSPGFVAAGGSITYVITASNAGPSVATDVAVIDTLPALFSAGAVLPAGCSAAGQVVTCVLGNLVAGAQGEVSIPVSVDPGAPAGQATNSVEVASAVPDPSPANNTATEPTTVFRTAVLAVSKVDGADPVAAGDDLTYTIDVTNNGPSTATGTVLTDTLPAGVTFVSATPDQGTCSEAGGVVTCDLGELAVGTTQVLITVTVPLDTPNGTTLSNSVTVTSTDASPVSTTETTAVEARVDLAVSKASTPSPPDVLAGGPLTYTLTITNAGPSPEPAATVIDTLPAQVVFVSATPSQGSCSEAAGTVTCDLGLLAAAGSATVDIAVTIDADVAAGTVLTNTATVSGTAVDTDPTNNIVTLDTAVETSADLSVTKSDTPDPVPAGEELTYTVTVSNIGPSDATGVTTVDTLPPEVVFVSATPGQGTCAEAAGVVTCDLGAIATPASTTVTIVVEVDPATPAGTITNSVTVSAVTPDPDPANDTATAETAVATAADLSVAKSDTPDPVVAGETLVYAIAVDNLGPSDAAGVVLMDILPAGFTVTSLPAACTEAAGTVTCNIGLLAAGASMPLVIEGTVGASIAAGAVLTNTAAVSSTSPDPDPDNNASSTGTTVIRQSDLGVTKVDAPDPVVAGAQLTYTIGVTNGGPSDEAAPVVTDVLPAGVSFVSSTGGCVDASGTLTCALPPLAAGGSTSFQVVVAVLASVADGAVLTNTATVSGAGVDPDGGNDTATAQTTVNREADLSIGKSGAPDPVLAGEQLTYNIVVSNAGPSDASGVTVQDTLPVGTAFVSGSAGCVAAGGVVTCTVGNLAVGGSAPVQIILTVPASAPDGTILTNQAEVTGNETDPDGGNNTVTIETTVARVADLAIDKSGSPNPVQAGTPLTYDLAVVNDGPSDASGVTIVDTLSPSVSYDPAASDPRCTEVPVGTVTCLIGDLAVGDGDIATIVVNVDPQAPIGMVITNTAVVSGDESDDDPTNNTSTIETEVDDIADLALTKSLVTSPLVAGLPSTWALLVTNDGPSAALGTVLTDTLPPGTTFVSATPAVGTCDHAGGIVTCDLDGIQPLDTVDVTIVVDVLPDVGDGTILTNSAEVMSTVADPDPANNQASASGTVTTVADLSVTKVAAPDTFVAGQPAAYRIVVSNPGPSDAVDVTVVDTLPPGVTAIEVTSSAGTCTVGAVVTCELGALAAGSSVQIDIVAEVGPAVVGPLTNTAAVTSPTSDPDPSNNEASVTSTVASIADLAISKSVDPQVWTAGASIQWTILVTNAGPSSAATATLTDAIPATVTGVTWTCEVTSGSGGCLPTTGSGSVATQLDLAPGSVATVVLTGTVAVGASGTIANRAVVENPGDPTIDDNSASASAQQGPGTGGTGGGEAGGIGTTGIEARGVALGGLILVVAGLILVLTATRVTPLRAARVRHDARDARRGRGRAGSSA